MQKIPYTWQIIITKILLLIFIAVSFGFACSITGLILYVSDLTVFLTLESAGFACVIAAILLLCITIGAYDLCLIGLVTLASKIINPRIGADLFIEGARRDDRYPVGYYIAHDTQSGENLRHVRRVIPHSHKYQYVCLQISHYQLENCICCMEERHDFDQSLTAHYAHPATIDPYLQIRIAYEIYRTTCTHDTIYLVYRKRQASHSPQSATILGWTSD